MQYLKSPAGDDRAFFFYIYIQCVLFYLYFLSFLCLFIPSFSVSPHFSGSGLILRHSVFVTALVRPL